MYARFNMNFVRDKYINSIIENNNRNAIIQFKLTSHDLANEQGRYQHID